MTEPKPTAEPEAPEKPAPRLRPLQVTASALAAVTGAFLASRLGVYGTIAGVGVISVLSTVIGEFYLRSLERTSAAASYATLAAKVRAVRSTADDVDTVVLPDRPSRSDRPVAGEPTAVDGTAVDGTAIDGTVVDGTAHGFAAEDGTMADPAKPSITPAAAAVHTRAAASGLLTRLREFGRLRWSAVAAGSVAACILAVLAITGIEALTGSKLSGGEGRTFASVVVGDDDEPEESEPQDEPGQPGDEGEPGGEEPRDPAPTPTPTDAAQTPTPSPTSTPTEGTEPGEPPAEEESPQVEVPDDADGGEPGDGP